MGKLYDLIRQIHLYTAFVVAAFLFMYFVTGGVMIMHSIFPRNTQDEITQSVSIDSLKSESAIVNSIQEQFKITGFQKRIERNDGRIAFNHTRPGYFAQILLNPQANTADIKIQIGTFASVMNSYHRLRGFEGFAHSLWAVLYDLACIGLILFAISGVYLWWRLIRRKLWGYIFLFISTGLTVFTVSYLFAVG